MNLIIRNAHIIDPGGPHHNELADIAILDGRISEIGSQLKTDEARVVELDNLHVSPGWFDPGISTGEPGREERDTLKNTLFAAALSGFTDVAIQPTGVPAADNASQIAWLISKSQHLGATAHPIGNLTKDAAGKDLAELYDMQSSGAVAFGDYNQSVGNANLLKIALQYARDFDAMIIAHSADNSLAGKGLVHEGAVATGLGLKGIPAIAEEIAVASNMMLLEYTGGKMHIPAVSTRGAVERIRLAKAKGLKVTCSVTVHHLLLTDDSLTGFDTNFKVAPPLRDESHLMALREGLLDGTIDMITTDHNPIDIENKKVEFALAEDGTIGLESAFGVLGTIFPTQLIVEKLIAGKPHFRVESNHIAPQNTAKITLFDPTQEGVFGMGDIKSKSKNSAFLGHRTKGFVFGTINSRQIYLK